MYLVQKIPHENNNKTFNKTFNIAILNTIYNAVSMLNWLG